MTDALHATKIATTTDADRAFRQRNSRLPCLVPKRCTVCDEWCWAGTVAPRDEIVCKSCDCEDDDE